MTRNVVFLFVAGLLLFGLVAASVYAFRQRRRALEATWETLVLRLRAIDRENIARVVLDLDDSSPPKPRMAELTPKEIWNLVGGLQGLKALEANCEVLVDLAFYLQSTYPHVLVIAEELRANAREIQWHIQRLSAAERIGKEESALAAYAQQAAFIYYQMTQSLLGLYEAVDAPEAATLRATI